MTSTDNQSANSPVGAEPVLTEGQKLAGCYVLRRKVETGDASVVWLAHDEVLGKDISLHFLPPAVRADPRAIEEIRKEVKRNRQLIHPHILRVHDFIEEPEFSAVAMDSFEAESLASLLKKCGPLAPGAVQPWIGPLCQTLEDAHKINLIHRDLAPANIYLGQDGKVLVSSFGISRCVQDAIGRASRGSHPRLGYMSPQQAEGQAATRTDDVYSLGMLLFELFTGELPFNGGDVVSQIRRVAAPRVSARLAAGRKNADLPASWDETIAAALRKDAAQRPTGALDFAGRLEAVAARELKPADAPAATAKPSETARRSGIVPPNHPAEATAKKAKSETPELALEAKAAGSPAKKEEKSAHAAEQDFKGGSESPSRKAVDILRERAAELKKAQGAQPGVGGGSAVQAGKSESAGKGRDSKTPPPPPSPATASGKKSESADIYPMPPQRSRGPALGLAAGIALAAIGIGGYFASDPGVPVDDSVEDPDIATTEPPYGSDIQSVNNKGALPSGAPDVVLPTAQPEPAPMVVAVATPPVKVPAAPAPKPEPETSKVSEQPKQPEPPKSEMLLAARKPATPAPAPVATPATPVTTATVSDAALAEKMSAVEKLKQEIQASEKAHLDLLKQQQQAEAATAEVQKALDLKSKDLAPLKKAADDLVKSRKAREDAQKAAELEAQRAQQVAAEKTRLAEEAKKALADLEAQNKEKQMAQEKADAELAALQKSLVEKQQTAAAVTKAAAETQAAREKQLAAMRQAEAEAEQTKLLLAKSMAAETARKAREEAEQMRAQKAQERERIEGEIAAMRKMFEEKMKVLEDAQKAVTDAEAKSKDTETLQKKAEEEALKILNKATAPAGGKPAVPDKAPAPEKPVAGGLNPADNPLTPAPAAAPAVTLAMKTDPSKPEAPKADPSTTKPEQGAGLQENSLGMKFAPVGDAHFAIWQTRVKDFEVFAKAVNLRSNAWKGPGFKQAPDHPVVNVTWQEALAFCKWLTDKERKEGALAASQVYRLPTDVEWSRAVGLTDEAGKTPEARDMGVPDVYPWGNQWPPPAGAGNYTGEETGSDVAIKGYDDGFAWTSPVGSFPANKFGLYDMGGNVWQWVMDAWNSDSKHKVLRGASWYNGALKLSLLSSCRVHASADSSTDNYGFRIVRASETSKGAR